MLYKINIDNKYDSSKLLFSIPVHENQEIINNQIENIFNYNPNSKIILHINKSFSTYDESFTKYHNLFINPIQNKYEYAKGLLFIHINNFLEAIKQNIIFDYFIIISSNEMFIKYNLISYINKFKNGSQIVKNDKSIKWHNFNKNIENELGVSELLKELNLNTIYGGQTEGQFFEKDVFNNIANIYLKHFGNKELNNFETEEVIIQTIFKSFNIEYGLPITLQNYSNNIVFNEKFIENIINNNIIIQDNTIKNNLFSPHINFNCDSIFSIKRIDRTFNNIRSFLSRRGFILNKEIFQLHTYYYSNNSSLILYNNNQLSFKKNKYNKSFDNNWFGYQLEDGYYNISFEFKSLYKIHDYKNIGLKIHFPYEILYNYFFENLDLEENINVWKKVKIPIHIKDNDKLIFIFDDYLHNLNIEFKNINIEKVSSEDKNNLFIILYETEKKNNDYTINYNNIYKMIIEPFLKNYNIYTFVSLLNNDKKNIIANYYKPSDILFLNNTNITNIFIKNTDQIIKFKKENEVDFKFVLYIKLDSIFKKNIIDFNFYINKFNFISYYTPYINNKISNSHEFMSIPSKYINKFFDLLNKNKENMNICNFIYHNLRNEIDDFNFIYDDNYTKNIRTPLIKYLSDIDNNTINNNNGYTFNKKYLYNVFYKNNFSKIFKNENNEFYFYKKETFKEEYYQWIGMYVDTFDNLNKNEKIDIIVNFDIKLLTDINKSNINFGLKTHEPNIFYNDWLYNCEIGIYKNIELNITINKINQYIILNFDNYNNKIDFYINNFKILNLFRSSTKDE